MAHAQAQAQAHYSDSSPVAPTASDANPSSTTNQTDPPSQAQQSSSGLHKRVYQACIPCRRRKVRCDLGSVDNPHDPPCVRCRRESKECYFSATRRKRKNEEGDDHEDEYIIRNGRKRLHTDVSPPPVPTPAIDRRLYNDVPLTPGGSVGRSQPLRRPGADEHARSDSRSSITGSRGRSATEFPADEPNTPLENYEARTVMRKEVYGPHDALDLLYKAATDIKHDGGVHAHNPSPQTLNLQTPSLSGAMATGLSRNNDGILYTQHTAAGQRMDAPIDPQLTKVDQHRPEPALAHVDALRAWTRFRFVRAGWFTAQEAIDYID